MILEPTLRSPGLDSILGFQTWNLEYGLGVSPRSLKSGLGKSGLGKSGLGVWT